MTDKERDQINRSDLERINAAADYLKAEAEDLDQYEADLFEYAQLDDELIDTPIRVLISDADNEK